METLRSKIPVWLVGLILAGAILSSISCLGPGWGHRGGGWHHGGGYHDSRG
jgi:hypothetical protein